MEIPFTLVRMSAFSVCVLSTVVGCSFAPGMRMDAAVQNASQMPVDIPNINIVPISHEVIISERAARADERSARPPGLLIKQQVEKYQYHVGKGDVLSIVVYNHPELTIPAGEFRSADTAGHVVTDEGKIFFPFMGELKVSGKTTQQIRRMIRNGIASKITDPQVDVRVAAFNSQKIYVMGEVQTPGMQKITNVPVGVLDAIGGAGGVTDSADRVNVVLTRGEETFKIDLLSMYEHGDVKQDYILQDGDVVNVPDRLDQKVFVMGEVMTPQSLIIHDNFLTLAEALSDVGGINPVTANPEQIYVIRGNSVDESTIFHLNAASPDALLLGQAFALRPRDVVYVETAEVARWNRLISQILPSASALVSIGSVSR